MAIATGHLVDGIRAELARERLIAPGEAHLARVELLGQLRAAAERGVSLTPPPGSDATLRGWLEAASVAQDNARNPTLGATRLAAFRTRYPTHPALGALAGEPSVGGEEPVAALETAPHLALILPLTGRTAGPAAQIRDGFLTAYYQLPANSRPRLRVYDSATTSISDTIAQAAAAGAEFIVGPLTREEVTSAAEVLTTRPPVLALNFLPSDRPAPERFYQFALSPEDDARAVARYIGASGRRHGVVIVPEGTPGRVAAAFDEELRAAGGSCSASRPSTPRTGTMARVIAGAAYRQQPHPQRAQATIGQKLELSHAAARHPVHLCAEHPAHPRACCTAVRFHRRR